MNFEFDPKIGVGDFALVVLTGLTIVLVYLGVRTARRQFRLQALRDRVEMYLTIEEPITKEQVEIAEELWEEYFDKSVFLTFYKGHPDRIRRYLGMMRRYHYLFYCRIYDREMPVLYGVDFDLWTEELGRIREFQDVHQRYARYYPALAPEYIDPYLEKPHRIETVELPLTKRGKQ